MKEPTCTEEKAMRVMLVGIRDEKMSVLEANSLVRELAGLALTLGLEIVSEETVNVRGKSAQYGIGSGKAEELSQKAASLEADCIIFDCDLSPSQQRNWEDLAGFPVIDRQELIIQIFASRAKTREAELQISLAELNYALPRLRHKYINLSRQRGGSYGTRGAGETRFETDRRRVEQRIERLKEELEEVKCQRQVQRKQRERQGISICALVGYTNAGKSSILNALTGAGVLAEDKLFATLDSTSRRLELPQSMQVLLIDTVGFIRRLPHSLVNAFRSTLEEVRLADLLLNIVDASSPDAKEQYETTLSVLRDLGADTIPMITVLNKVDLLTDPLPAAKFPVPGTTDSTAGNAEVSALDGRGLPELCKLIEKTLSGARICFRFPSDRTDLAAFLHRSGQVISEKYTENFIEMEARVDEQTSGRLKEYRVNE